MSLFVERFQPGMAAQWNAFIQGSRNGTFLLDRGYMDYHADRFRDHSLVVRDSAQTLTAVLPANETSGRLHSHGGLTYGGLILAPRIGAAVTLEALQAVRGYMACNDLSHLYYKSVPWIYHRQPAEDDRYALFRLGARLTRRDTLSVVPSQDRLEYQNRRTRGVRKAAKAGISILESDDYREFWSLLTNNLMQRYSTTPVHSLSEIHDLHHRFPDSIRLFTAILGGEIVAGTVIYESRKVAHAQYISTNDNGRRMHALDLLFDHLLTCIFANKAYFDFGISNEMEGHALNLGLLEQKEGFGARCVVHDHYELSA